MMTCRVLCIYLFCIGYVHSLDNLSLHKEASMSSSLYVDKWLSSAAVDGNTDQSLGGNSCSVTSDNYKVAAWWKVNLGAVSSITEVKIYYRDDGDGVRHTPSLSGFKIYVSNESSTFGTVVYIDNGGVQANPGPTSVSTFPCNATGQYVTIHKSRTDTCTSSSGNTNFCAQLQLCEVQVLGTVDDSKTSASTSDTAAQTVALAVGLTVGFLLLIVIIIIIIFLYRRGYFSRWFNKGQQKRSENFANGSQNAAVVVSDDENRYSNNPQPVLYSQVQNPKNKPSLEATTSSDPPLYSEVKKDKKVDTNSGAISQGAETGPTNTKNMNQQGLVYSDLQFEDTNRPIKPQRVPENTEERVAYASLEI